MDPQKTKQVGELVRFDLVLLGKVHNPSIISPDWLREKCEILEDPKQFVHTPEFSMFDSESLQIVVDPNRLQTISKKTDDISLNLIVQFAEKYVNVLPHIPYIAAGLNFVWQWKGSEAARPQFSISSSGNLFPNEFNGYSIDFGGVIYGHCEDHNLRVLIEAQSPEHITFNCNFHFDISDKPQSLLPSIFKKFESLKESSMKIVDRLINPEEKL